MFRCGVAIAGLASLVWLSCNAQQDHHAFSSKGTSKSFNIRQLCRNVAGGRGVKVQDSPRGDDDRGLLLGFFGWLYLVSEQNFSRQCCSSMLFIHSCRAEKSIFLSTLQPAITWPDIANGMQNLVAALQLAHATPNRLQVCQVAQHRSRTCIPDKAAFMTQDIELARAMKLSTSNCL